MSVNLELALAARWVRAEIERMRPEDRPDVATAWKELLDAVNGSRSDGGAELEIIAWRARMQNQLSREASAVQ